MRLTRSVVVSGGGSAATVSRLMPRSPAIADSATPPTTSRRLQLALSGGPPCSASPQRYAVHRSARPGALTPGIRRGGEAAAKRRAVRRRLHAIVRRSLGQREGACALIPALS